MTRSLSVAGIADIKALLVNGQSVIARIEGIEREIAALKTSVATLANGGSNSSNNPGTGPSSASIGVELLPGSGPFSNLRIFGSGFGNNETVEVTVESRTSPTGATGTSTSQGTADSSGRINITIGVSCQPGVSTTHTARARGTSSGRISNVAAASC